ncbi:MAG: thiol:disulfide interchange protein DsbA/DsbL [Burkholderiaceae bacterium]|nr:MAG: thiol:disulfide interchange protein DsbA/DsbL [Burkholderiaceae bacterium]
MKRRAFALSTVTAALAPLWLPATAQAADEGYITLKTPVPTDVPAGKVRVIEFFSYGCIHCMHFAPILSAWEKDKAPAEGADLRLVHVGFSKAFEPLQKIFYALEAIGQRDKVHEKLFTALQVDKIRLDQPDVLFPWMAKNGVDRTKFEAAYNSFGVATQVRRANELQEAYQVEGTPALGIAGKYYTDGSMARGFDRMLQITDTLVAKERKA